MGEFLSQDIAVGIVSVVEIDNSGIGRSISKAVTAGGAAEGIVADLVFYIVRTAEQIGAFLYIGAAITVVVGTIEGVLDYRTAEGVIIGGTVVA